MVIAPLAPPPVPTQNGLMTRFASIAAAALFATCHSLSAQVSDPFLFNSSPLNRSSLFLPPIALTDQDRVSFLTALSWQTPTEYLPPFSPVEPRHSPAVKTTSRETSEEATPELTLRDRIHVGGEIGFLYGRSTGKYGYEYEQGYVIGEIGTDKFHLTIGYSHERTNWHLPSR